MEVPKVKSARLLPCLHFCMLVLTTSFTEELYDDFFRARLSWLQPFGWGSGAWFRSWRTHWRRSRFFWQEPCFRFLVFVDSGCEHSACFFVDSDCVHSEWRWKSGGYGTEWWDFDRYLVDVWQFGRAPWLPRSRGGSMVMAHPRWCTSGRAAAEGERPLQSPCKLMCFSRVPFKQPLDGAGGGRETYAGRWLVRRSWIRRWYCRYKDFWMT